ncbi:hypothetical protein Hte_009609 [Hypoxylon texense]
MDSQRAAYLQQHAEDLVGKFLREDIDDSQSQVRAAVRTAKDSQTNSWVKLEAHCDKLKKQAEEVEKETEGLKERWVDVENWKGKVEDLRQDKFNNLLSLYMGPDGDGSLDRFRKMSLSHRQALFNIEKETKYEELERAKDADIDKLRAEVDQARQEGEEAKRRHGQAVQEAQAEIDGLTHALLHEEEAASSLENAIRRGLAGVDKYKHRLGAIDEKDIANLREILGQGLDEFGEKCRELELLHTNEIPSLSRSISDLQTQLTQLTQVQEESHKNLADSQAYAQEVAKQLDESKRQIERLEKSIDEKQALLSSEQKKIEKLESNLKITKQQARDRERELRENHEKVLQEKTIQLAAEEEKSEDLGAMLQKSDALRLDSTRDLEESTGRLSREKQRAEGLSRELRKSGRVVEGMQRQEIGLARFYMEQSGEAQDAQNWTSFMRTTFVRPWKSTSVPLDIHLQNDMMALVVRLRGSVVSGAWKNETVEIVRALVAQVEQAAEAPVVIILEVPSLFLKVDLENLAGELALLARLVGFGLWQLACLIQRRWPQVSGMHHMTAALEKQVVSRAAPLRILSMLIGNDCGEELRTLIRRRQDPHPLPPQSAPSHPESSSVSVEYEKLPAQYCQEQDIGLLCLPESGNYVWAIRLGVNTIRMIETSRLEYRADLC